LAFIVGSASFALGDQLYPVLVGEIIDLDTGVTTNVGGVSAAFNSIDDEYRVVWFDSRISGQNDVYAQRVSPAGELLGDNVTIVSGSPSQTDTAVAYSPADNRYFITWQYQGGPPGSPGFNHAYGGLASATGGLIQTPFDVSNGGLEATLVYNSVSDQYFLEARNFAGGGVGGIRGQRISAAGTLVGGGISIATSGAPAPAGQVAYNRNANQYLATWRDQSAENLKGRLINADGSFATSAFVISPIFPASGVAAGVACDPFSERYLVVFGTFMGGPIQGQLVTTAGSLDGDPFTIVDGSARVSPLVAYDEDNAVFLVAWLNSGTGSVGVQLLAFDGFLLGDPLEIIGDSASGLARVAANANDGGFIVTWVDRSAYPTRVDVVAQLVGVVGDGPCNGDLDGDGDVDLSDLAQLLAHYGVITGASCEDGDMDEDGDVDLADLAALLAVYGTIPP
jgi:hypothetical protein